MSWYISIYLSPLYLSLGISSIYPFLRLTSPFPHIFPLTYPSIYSFIHLTLHPSEYPFIRVSISLFYPSILYLSIHEFKHVLCLSVTLSIYLHLTVRLHSLGWIKEGYLSHSTRVSSDGNAGLTSNSESSLGCQGVELIPKTCLHILEFYTIPIHENTIVSQYNYLYLSISFLYIIYVCVYCLYVCLFTYNFVKLSIVCQFHYKSCFSIYML